MSTLKYLFPFLHLRNAVFPTNLLVKTDVCRHFYCNKINTAINSDTDDATDTEKGQSRQNVRRLALKLLYIGDRYNGMQQQIDLQNTIEEHLFGALVKARLIQDSVSCNFKKSSKTDKGVSAISQVVAFDVQDDYFKLSMVKCEDYKSKDIMDCRDLKWFNSVIRRINRHLLPDGIKVLGWSFVPEDFIPRKLNRGKTYKYWFKKESLDLKVMTEACKKFEGTHDFRNLSTMQLKNSYTCTIKSAAITPCEEDPRVCVFTLSGDRFLTHQIRNMMGILYLIGSGREDPTVIDELLDIKTNPGKPQYGKAEALPLCLIKTELASDVKWIYDHSLLHPIYRAVQKKYIDSMLLSSMAKEILDELKTTELDSDDGSITLEEMMKNQVKPVRRASIMSSKRGLTVEEFIAKEERKNLRKKLARGELSDVASIDIQEGDNLFLETSKSDSEDVDNLFLETIKGDSLDVDSLILETIKGDSEDVDSLFLATSEDCSQDSSENSRNDISNKECDKEDIT